MRWCSLLLVLVCGCAVPMADVSGTVLMDGKPLGEGEIIFEETDQSKTPVGCKVTKGEYQVKMLPGSKLVRITASRPTKIPDPVMGAAAREHMIGQEYNAKSTLKVEVSAGVTKGVNFEVKSIP